MKRYLFFLLLLTNIFLGWCFWWDSDEKNTIEFENFQISIDPWYESVSSDIFEQKQIKNEIIASYRDWELSEFNNNMIITKTNVKINQSAKEFARANSSIIINNMPATNFWGLNEYNFSCKWWNIKWYYWNFWVFESVFDKQASYYMTQYYFVYNKTWYVVSFMWEEKMFDTFAWYIESISCN